MLASRVEVPLTSIFIVYPLYCEEFSLEVIFAPVIPVPVHSVLAAVASAVKFNSASSTNAVPGVPETVALDTFVAPSATLAVVTSLDTPSDFASIAFIDKVIS